MGLTNELMNLEALESANGDVFAAVKIIERRQASEERKKLAIIVKLQNVPWAIVVREADCVRDIKRQVQDMIKVAPKDQRLLFRGNVLPDTAILGSYDMHHREELTLICDTPPGIHPYVTWAVLPKSAQNPTEDPSVPASPSSTSAQKPASTQEPEGKKQGGPQREIPEDFVKMMQELYTLVLLAFHP
jgi:hypothetical protein